MKRLTQISVRVSMQFENASKREVKAKPVCVENSNIFFKNDYFDTMSPSLNKFNGHF